MHGMTRLETARHSTAWHGTAWHGTAWHGVASHCTARHGTARHGTARHGTAWRATARHGTVVGAGKPIINSARVALDVLRQEEQLGAVLIEGWLFERHNDPRLGSEKLQ